jgi:outer membrane receptor protein involved in Fe transport
MQAPGKYSITPITAAVTAALYPGHAAVAQDTNQNQRALEEIVVTARKRTESVQDIPATIQAISQESLAAMGAKTMEDYARFVPSVNVVQYGSNASTVVFRGAITGAGYIGQATSSVYLDEISITQTGSQPSIRAVDLERVEALSGPQGTLYGSDAQAGTMRMITNKPVMNAYQTVFDGEVRGGGDSDASYRGSLVFNVPLVEDKLALRFAGYSDRDGGYIDNVLGHTADWFGLEGENKAPANLGPVQWGTLDNSGVLENNWNDNSVYGGRLQLRWEMNDSWAATASYHYQKAEDGASNAYDPFVGERQIVRFHDEYRNEEFNMASLVLEGDMGFAQVVAAVSYYDRKIDGLDDITNYAHYWAAAYCHDSNYTPAYIDANPQYFPYYTGADVFPNPDTGYVVWWPIYCMGPTIDSDYYSSYKYISNDDKLTGEIRLSSQGDSFDWIIGGYFEQSKDSWLAPFATPTTGGRGDYETGNLYQDSISLQFYEWYFGTALPTAAESWSSGSHTDWKQAAIFGEATWHINDLWDLTIGGRYFDRSNTNYYFVNHPGRLNFNEGEPDFTTPDIREYRLANDLRPFGRKGTEKKFIPKISLSYAVGDNSMIYGLYTQGVRQGGVNRSRGEPFFPRSYDSDLMNNYEVGYKSTFAEGRGRLNVTGYYMLWEDYQLQIIDPASSDCPDGEPADQPGICGQPWQDVIANLGEAHIQGFNVELDYQIGDNWLFGMNFEDMEAETDTAHDLNGDDVIDVGDGDLVKGLRLPLVPDYKTSAWLEYRMPANLFGSDEFFVRTQWSYTGDSVNRLEPLDPADQPNAQFHNPAYTIGDLRAGLVGEDWQFDVFVNNITDELAMYTTQTGLYEWGWASVVDGRDHHQTVYTNRPREVGVRFMKRWGD